jgi:ABC-type spermidine/putrescine transport system permease subunit I
VQEKIQATVVKLLDLAPDLLVSLNSLSLIIFLVLTAQLLQSPILLLRKLQARPWWEAWLFEQLIQDEALLEVLLKSFWLSLLQGNDFQSFLLALQDAVRNLAS